MESEHTRRHISSRREQQGTPPIFCSNEYFNLYTRQLCRLNHKYSMMMYAPQWGSHGDLLLSLYPSSPQKTYQVKVTTPRRSKPQNGQDLISWISIHTSHLIDFHVLWVGVCVDGPCPNAIYVNYRVVVRDRLTKIRGSLINLALSLAIFIPSII